MTTDPAFKKAFYDWIDKRIEKLKTLRELFAEEFDARPPVGVELLSTVDTPRRRSHHATNRPQGAQRLGRREAVLEFLKKNGPTGRQGIHEQTGIPLGTISHVLNDKKTFKIENGLWVLVKAGNAQKLGGQAEAH